MSESDKSGKPEHIQKLFDEVNTVEPYSKRYWELRATYREKMDDMTYTQYERDNCFQLWRQLINI